MLAGRCVALSIALFIRMDDRHMVDWKAYRDVCQAAVTIKLVGKHPRWTVAQFIMGAGISVLSLLKAMTDNELPRALQSVFNFLLVKDSQSLGS